MPTLTTRDSSLEDASVDFIQHIIISGAVESGFWGMYFILMIMSTYALIQEGLSGSRARQMLLFCTSIMFSAATVTMFIDVATSVLEILFYDPSAVYPDALLIRWDMVTNVMVRLVFVMSDVIVVWRAWVLWKQSQWARMLLAICFAVDFVSALVDLALTLVLDVRNDGEQRSGTQSLLLTIPVLATNILSTALVAYKTWQYYQSFRLAKLDVSSHRVKVGRVLNVLVCAGVVYCVFWALFIVSTFGALKFPGTDIVIDIIPQISGIYPTLIIILAALERHHSSLPFDKPTAPLGSLHFARAPLPTRNVKSPARDSSIDNYTTTDRREREVQSVSRSHTLRSHSAVVPTSDEGMYAEGERSGDEWDIRLKEERSQVEEEVRLSKQSIEEV